MTNDTVLREALYHALIGVTVGEARCLSRGWHGPNTREDKHGHHSTGLGGKDIPNSARNTGPNSEEPDIRRLEKKMQIL